MTNPRCRTELQVEEINWQSYPPPPTLLRFVPIWITHYLMYVRAEFIPSIMRQALGLPEVTSACRWLPGCLRLTLFPRRTYFGGSANVVRDIFTCEHHQDCLKNWGFCVP